MVPASLLLNVKGQIFHGFSVQSQQLKAKSESWLHAACLFLGQVSAESRDRKSVLDELLKSHTFPVTCGLLRVSIGV
jgi:hypothetical protein